MLCWLHAILQERRTFIPEVKFKKQHFLFINYFYL